MLWRRELYTSSSGDRWFLAWDKGVGLPIHPARAERSLRRAAAPELNRLLLGDRWGRPRTPRASADDRDARGRWHPRHAAP